MLHYDYLVAGSGLAGLFAAQRASRYGSVAIITKSNLTESNTFYAQGGIASVTGEDDLPRFHFQDTVAAGRGLCDPQAVDILVNEGPQRIAELIKDGMLFDMDKTGSSFELGLEGGHHKRRVLHAGGDITGRKISEFMIKKIKENKKITLYENHNITEIITSGNYCQGLRVWDSFSNQEKIFTSNHTIMALGGASAIYERTTNPSTTIGDGIALCYNAGCRIADMEFIQFHPTALSLDKAPSYLISEAVRGDGAYLVNSKGERFMLEADPLAELAPRDVVAKAIYRQGKVFLSLSHLNPDKIKKRFPNIYEHCAKLGIDMTRQIPVAPAAHYMVGGVVTNYNGKTDIDGLYSCGEMASTGIMGANRLASNSLAECIVFGYRAIEDTIKAKPIPIPVKPDSKYFIDHSNLALYNTIKKETAKIMSHSAGIIRNKQKINEGLEKVRTLQMKLHSIENHKKQEIYTHFSKNLLTVATLILKGALEREESRGGHFREDFPEENNNELYHTIQQKNKPIKRHMITSAQKLIEKLISLAIEEDTANGDITTNSLVPESYKATATLTAKQTGVISGLEIARKVFEHFDKEIVFKSYKAEGEPVCAGEVVARISGSFRALLTGERTALNILQRMSGIATETNEYAKLLEGTKTQLLDTRKTAPGMRHLDKMAVAAGGGKNHRKGLYDMVLVKDNHIKVAGSITKAVGQIREKTAPGTIVEVETTNLAQVQEAIDCKADIIMLDNMDTETMEKAVRLIDKRAKTEASGNMDYTRIKEVAKTGVDYISVGALTHSVKALDISMNIEV